MSHLVRFALLSTLVFQAWPVLAAPQEQLANVAALPAPERAQWETYLAQSTALHETEATQLSREAGEQKPIPAPTGADFKVKSQWQGDWYKSEEATKITEAILSFQTPSGGWSKAVSVLAGPRKTGMQWTSQTSPFHYAATFDNRATTEQIEFLNRVLAVNPRDDVKLAIERGLDYIFVAQYPNGGWPQTFPLEGGYHDAITFNDNAMIHILLLLNDVSNKQQWEWLDSGRRQKSKIAVEKGIACILATQVEQNGVKTVWCAQHDALTLLPTQARLKEPVSLSGGESVATVRFLMSLPPSPASNLAIEGALAWFEKSKMTDAAKAPVWARFYDVKTNVPLFAGAQDGIIYDSFDAMAAKNRVGYDYFVTSPRDLLAKAAPQWRKSQKLNP